MKKLNSYFCIFIVIQKYEYSSENSIRVLCLTKNRIVIQDYKDKNKDNKRKENRKINILFNKSFNTV